jgi:RNA polymerase primary sigma factor
MDDSSIYYLFREVRNLPILTNRAQELWLGIKIRAPKNWQALLKLDGCGNEVALSAIYASLYAQSQKLVEACERLEIRPPNISQWITDIHVARKNIYDLRRSKLRRFVRSVGKRELSSENIQSLTKSSYKVAELLVILPNDVLRHIRKSERLPLPDLLKAWITKEPPQIGSVRQTAKQQAARAKRMLITGYLRYALRMARRHVDQGVDYVDLVQVACLGLIHAANKFNYQEHSRFATYASTWMWQKVNREIDKQSRVIRVPIHVQNQIREIQEVYEQLWGERKRAPTLDELLLKTTYLEEEQVKRIEQHRAACTPLPKDLRYHYRKGLQTLRLRLASSQTILSLDAISDNIESPLVSNSTSLSQDLLIPMARMRMMEKVYDLLESFSKRDQAILKMRFGLETGEEHTLAEVGEAFDLTRERVRQIETRMLNYLTTNISEQQLRDCLTSQVWPLSFGSESSLMAKDLFPSQDQNSSRDWEWLDRLLEELPGGDWHRGQGRSSREEQLVEALQALQEPTHYSVITEQLNDMLDHEAFDEKYIYSVLFKYEDSFVLLGEGIFSLVSWEKKRTKVTQPVLPFCPTTLPDELERDHVFFESVLVAREMLKQELTVRDFLERILTWAGVTEPQSTWLLQSVLSAYYVVGVIPYVFYPDAKSDSIISTAPEMNLQELRRYCLRMVTQRLIAMPQFWWLMQRYEPARACDISEYFIDVHPLELDDTYNRLELLTSIGAAQKSQYARFRLTSLGQKLASQFGEAPHLFQEEVDTVSQSMENLDTFDLISF